MMILTLLVAPPFLAWLFYEVVIKGGREFDEQIARTQAEIDRLKHQSEKRRRESIERFGRDIYG